MEMPDRTPEENPNMEAATEILTKLYRIKLNQLRADHSDPAATTRLKAEMAAMRHEHKMLARPEVIEKILTVYGQEMQKYTTQAQD
ncbi:MAG TPA: hypothetical protein PKA28_11905 [Methylomusa anaerophila]|uniref:Uncharacterized protein n=1 Tax=Methylomusa anaerophila TaxID=1930071 RepID=A0A348AFH2_9FIRM|nr:hypothetical protein [Methylomusa anaerophila]BBB89820.1 hypothetical protein MAMMFC1_00454 [Methylomusa anaerophila]HML89134.1 hypothetical protein [Methylomusa anaerophila]